jgi:hypothetical protein
MLAAVCRAEATHGANAEAIVVSGTPSTHRTSNITRFTPIGYEVVEIYPGARRQYRSEGFKNVVVVKKEINKNESRKISIFK